MSIDACFVGISGSKLHWHDAFHQTLAETGQMGRKRDYSFNPQLTSVVSATGVLCLAASFLHAGWNTRTHSIGEATALDVQAHSIGEATLTAPVGAIRNVMN